MSVSSIPSIDTDKLIRDHERYVTSFHAILDHTSEVPVLAPMRANEVADPRMYIDHSTCAPDYVQNPFPVISHDYFLRLIDQGRITNHMTFYMCILPNTSERRRPIWAMYEIKSPDNKSKSVHDNTIFPGYNVPVDPNNFEIHQTGSFATIIQGWKAWQKKKLYPCIKTALQIDREETVKEGTMKCMKEKEKQYKRVPTFVVEVEDSWYQSLHDNPNTTRKRPIESA